MGWSSGIQIAVSDQIESEMLWPCPQAQKIHVLFLHADHLPITICQEVARLISEGCSP